MKKRRRKPKSAMDELIDSFIRLREEAKQRMSPQEFQEAERQFDESVARIRERRKQKMAGHPIAARGRKRGIDEMGV